LTLPFPGDPFAPRRRATFEVRAGDVGIGGANPIRVQSMTTTDTLDTNGTADQVERLVRAGCEIVRITAPSLKEAENLAAIRAELARRGVRVPLVADIHFTPNAAMVAALHVEKVRINPGNYADKKRFEVYEYADAEYREEIERVADRFRPLVRRCKELGRAMRIGTNHGSLSDRIMNRYGDTPAGMVESALEFLDVCEGEGFSNVVFSMKSSNAQVAIQAYRLLAARLAARAGGPSYPFHLGVTEAGDGMDGRVKSAIGIGSLLEDGIGDTIRVSLTEDPVKEVPVARALAARYEARFAKPPAAAAAAAIAVRAPFSPDPFAHERRATRTIGAYAYTIGADQPVRVELDLGPVPADPVAAAAELAGALGRVRDVACEGVLLDVSGPRDAERAAAFADALKECGVAAPLALRTAAAEGAPAARAARYVARIAHVDPAALAAFAGAATERRAGLEWSFAVAMSELPAAVRAALAASDAAGIAVPLVSFEGALPIHGARLLAAALADLGRGDLPIALRHRSDAFLSADSALLHAATDLGAPLCDGIGDVVSLGGFGAPDRTLAIAYRILQGARLRTSWTEFISCPSCGRTLFDLEETTARIKERTAHLKGLKIAVMGCIVNGPGEMADADFGYVGSGVGKVNLYVGKECVVRNVPESDATDRLVSLIRDRGAWSDPN
jgi:(E)-4-hydroxy-3-methylbut-2-enyl-diphosphate synthase